MRLLCRLYPIPCEFWGVLVLPIEGHFQPWERWAVLVLWVALSHVLTGECSAEYLGTLRRPFVSSLSAAPLLLLCLETLAAVFPKLRSFAEGVFWAWPGFPFAVPHPGDSLRAHPGTILGLPHLFSISSEITVLHCLMSSVSQTYTLPFFFPKLHIFWPFFFFFWLLQTVNLVPVAPSWLERSRSSVSSFLACIFL